MTTQIASRLFPEGRAAEWSADIGCGTGLFSRDLTKHSKNVVCADPAPGMLTQLPQDPALLPVQGSLEDIVTDRIDLPHNAFDAILVKEAIHHVGPSDRGRVIDGSSECSPRRSAGRINCLGGGVAGQ